jgi:hypothetical protein
MAPKQCAKKGFRREGYAGTSGVPAHGSVS